MITLVFHIVAFGAVGWTQWVRRGTWRMQWESPATAASLMLGIAMYVATTVFAIATARSWQRKLDPWRRLINVTRARI